jgi:uncharacterized protein YbjT (DUF2867 family)
MTILVTGGRGAVARALVDELLAAGAPVRVGSRDPQTARVPPGVRVVPVDLARPETAGDALDGVRAVFLYAEPAGLDAFLAAAVAAKVERVVLLSSSSVDHDGRPTAIARMHIAAEEAIVASGLPWTFVRPGAFATNALAWSSAIRVEGVVRDAYPGSYVAPVHERDMAAVSAVALLRSGHEGAAYTLTGPETFTRRRQIEVIGEVLGLPLRFEEITGAQLRERSLAGGVPAGIIDALLHYLAESDGRPVAVSDAVAALTGRPARTFASWVADHADAFTGADQG